MSNSENVESVPTNETPRVIPARDELPDLEQIMLVKIDNYVTEWRKVDDRISAADNLLKSLPDLRKNSDNPVVVDLMNKVETASQAILEWYKEIDAILIGDGSTLTNDERNALEAQAKVLGDKIKSALKFYADNITPESPHDAVPSDYLSIPSGLSRTRVSSGSDASDSDSDGTRRLRVKSVQWKRAVNPDDATANWHEPLNANGKSTFTTLVADLKKNGVETSVSDLHDAYFASAGTTLAASLPAMHEFTVTYKGTDTYWFRVTK